MEVKERRHAFWVEAQRDVNGGGGRAHAFAMELIVMTEVKTRFGVRARAQHTCRRQRQKAWCSLELCADRLTGRARGWALDVSYRGKEAVLLVAARRESAWQNCSLRGRGFVQRRRARKSESCEGRRASAGQTNGLAEGARACKVSLLSRLAY